MTQEAFIKVLEEKGYSYKLEGDKIVVTHNKWVFLRSLETLPPDVEFRNKLDVFMDFLKTLPPGVVFKNGEDVYLHSLMNISPGVQFGNEGDVYLNSIIGEEDGYFPNWSGNIEGIKPNRLLNKMISIGLFDRR